MPNFLKLNGSFAKPAFLLVFGLFGFWNGSSNQALGERPNIVLIMIDDLGWTDVGCYGNEFIDTPHIDRLASNGIRFTDFYASGAVCSPTRCAVQSGQNQARIGITAHIPGHWRPFEKVITPQTTMALPQDTATVAEALADSGYQTGYVGKWHLGNGADFQPDRQGYQSAAVINGPHLPGKYRVQGNSTRQPKPGQYRTDFEAELGVDFIEKNKEKPFFLMISPFAVHIPLAGMSSNVEKYRQRAEEQNRDLPHPVYAAMVEHCDDLVGRIVEAIDSAGLTENTMIVFTSDNGGLIKRYDYQPASDDVVTTLAPLRSEKGSLYEGGIRVPLIIQYPPLVKEGNVCTEPTISHDFFATFVAAAEAELPKNQTIDGQSLLPLLQDCDAQLDRSALYWHYPHYHHDRPASCIREREWKLIEYLDGSGDVELYEISQDLGENRNLATAQPEKTAAMRKRLERWRKSVNARMPIVNPSYDPERASQWWSMRTGKPVPSANRRRFPATEKPGQIDE